MIASDNNNNGGFLFTSEIKSLLTESGKALTTRQREAAALYNRKSGTLQNALQGTPFTTSVSEDTQSLIFSYPKHIRAIDRQRTVYGRKKKDYHPIYNRPLYGEIYRYTIPMARGIFRRMFEQHRARLKQIFNKPVEI